VFLVTSKVVAIPSLESFIIFDPDGKSLLVLTQTFGISYQPPPPPAFLVPTLHCVCFHLYERTVFKPWVSRLEGWCFLLLTLV
jgi:hypothetical protein